MYEPAHLPHWFDTALWIGDTVPNGDPPEPYASDTELICALIAPQVLSPSDAVTTIEYGERTIRVWGVWFLYADEVTFKLEQGMDPLWDRLDAAGVMEALDPDRPSALQSP